MIVTVTEIHLSNEPQSYQIDLSRQRKPITLGRAQYCDHVLMHGDIRVSRIQTTLTPEGDEWYLHDGSDEYGASKSGIFIGGEKLKAKVKLKPGLEVSLFRSPIGSVDLLVEDAIAQLIDLPTDSGDAVVALRREIAELHREVIRRDGNCEQRLIELKAEFDEIKANDRGREAILAKVEGEIGALFELFNERFSQLSEQIAGTETELHRNKRLDGVRDQAIKTQGQWQTKVIGVLAVTTVGLSTWVATNGNVEAIKNVVPWAAGVLGLGAGGQALVQYQAKKPDESQAK
jgi:hypothetical protein